MNRLIIYSIWAKTQHYDAKMKLYSSTNQWLTHAWPLSLSVRSENNTPMVQVDKRSHLVLFKQNQRNHDPYTSELQKAYKTDHLVNRHNMMGTVSKLYVSNNAWIYVYVKTIDKISTPIPTPESFNSNSNSREFQLQFQLPRVSTPIPTPTPGVSTPNPTPASLLNINSNSGSFNSNSNSGKSLEYQLQLQLRRFQLQFQLQLRSWPQPWCSIEKVPYCFSRSFVIFRGHTGQKIANFDPNWAFPDCNSSLTSPMALKWCTKLDVVKKRSPIVYQGHPSNFKVTQDKILPISTRIELFSGLTPVWIHQWIWNDAQCLT